MYIIMKYHNRCYLFVLCAVGPFQKLHFVYVLKRNHRKGCYVRAYVNAIVTQITRLRTLTCRDFLSTKILHSVSERIIYVPVCNFRGTGTKGPTQSFGRWGEEYWTAVCISLQNKFSFYSYIQLQKYEIHVWRKNQNLEVLHYGLIKRVCWNVTP
jgi:hypothetical protein